MLTDNYPRVSLAHLPTPLERMDNLAKAIGTKVNLWVKRDDCTGLAMGGNKARQLEFYVGDAMEKGADVLLTTGAVQSNHVRSTVAAARKMGIEAEVQLEHRVSGRRPEYESNGNVVMVKLMGGKIHRYDVGEDESGADNNLYEIAKRLTDQGRKPYVIPLSPMNHPPYGALGYVVAAEEVLQQVASQMNSFDAIITPSGSATTHSGLLAGLRAADCQVPVYGLCVRRDAEQQEERVYKRTLMVAEMIDHPHCVTRQDVMCDDSTLGGGYGQLTPEVFETTALLAETEALFVDPTYSAKTVAGFINMVRQGQFNQGDNVVFLHTGGHPAIFAYPELLEGVTAVRERR